MILIYDIQGFPDESLGLTFEIFAKLFKEEKIIIWDSSNYVDNPIEPKIIFSPEDEVVEFKIINVDNEEDAEAMNKIMKQ